MLGSSTPDVAATLTVAGAGMGTADQDARRDAERLLAAFASGDLIRIGQSDAWSDIDGVRTRPRVRLAARWHRRHRPVRRQARHRRPTRAPGSSGGASTANAAPKAAVAPQATVLWSAVERPWLNQAVDLAVSRGFSQFDGPLQHRPAAGSGGRP